MDTAESEESALYVHGVGWIAQYHYWADMLWEKGIPFFIRDIKFAELQRLLEDVSEPPRQKRQRIRRLTNEVNELNRKLAQRAAE